MIHKLSELLGTVKTKTTPYHPCSDGLVERFNRTLLAMLAMFVSREHDNWDDLLPFMMLAYNTTVHTIIVIYCSYEHNALIVSVSTCRPADAWLLPIVGGMPVGPPCQCVLNTSCCTLEVLWNMLLVSLGGILQWYKLFTQFNANN